MGLGGGVRQAQRHTFPVLGIYGGTEMRAGRAVGRGPWKTGLMVVADVDGGDTPGPRAQFSGARDL